MTHLRRADPRRRALPLLVRGSRSATRPFVLSHFPGGFRGWHPSALHCVKCGVRGYFFVPAALRGVPRVRPPGPGSAERPPRAGSGRCGSRRARGKRRLPAAGWPWPVFMHFVVITFLTLPAG